MPNGLLCHPRLEKEREKQRKYREIKQQSGKIGAKNRWSKVNKDKKLNSNAARLPMANDSSSVFSLLSSSSDIDKTSALSEQSRLKIFIESEYQKIRGIKLITEKSDWIALANMKKAFNGSVALERLEKAWTDFLVSPDPFHQKQGHPLRYWSTNINAFIGERSYGKNQLHIAGEPGSTSEQRNSRGEKLYIPKQ
jgi:hypothetical protein